MGSTKRGRRGGTGRRTHHDIRGSWIPTGRLDQCSECASVLGRAVETTGAEDQADGCHVYTRFTAPIVARGPGFSAICERSGVLRSPHGPPIGSIFGRIRRIGQF